MVKKCLNFWLNFALNFKDKSFIDLIQSSEDVEKTTFLKKKLKDILKDIVDFLNENLSTKEKYSVLIEQNLFEFLEIIIRFDEMFENISLSSLNYIIEPEMSSTCKTCIQNFCTFSNLNISLIKEALYKKVGYAFLDFKGNFRKSLIFFIINYLVWADKYTKEVLFGQSEIEKVNLFDIMKDFSKYIIRNKYEDKFFDFKNENCRIRVFTYSIAINQADNDFINDPENSINNPKCLQNLFDNFNSTKTLVSRASAVLLQNYGDNHSNACILLETKLSPYRQNFDYFHWKKYID